ncbi:S26 family signal peptidase [Micromonospora echinofusca]|uniref:S26 family signal peptidase n=1 Tax=Micromonospora echinofusca TaxID=47858 RepID=UPI00340C96CB
MSWLLLVGAVPAVLTGGAMVLRHRHLLVTVRGQSMAPTHAHGDRVLVRRSRKGRVRTGQVVVVDLPERLRPLPVGVGPADALLQRRVIKRVAAVAGDPVPAQLRMTATVVPPDRIVLLGDNPDASGDSRQYGFVPLDAVVGVVVRRMSGPHRQSAANGSAQRRVR